MKKKLTAILLTLCMVLGMLPMSVLAAWYHNDAEVTLSGKTVEVDGNTYYILADNIPANPGEGDSIDYYEYYQGGYTWAGKLTWKADKAEEYTITVQKPENGTASASAVKAAAGAKVTVTATPSAGYELDKITVTGADGSVVKVASDNSFIMPAGNVTVTVTFKKTVVTPTEYTITAKAVPAEGGEVKTSAAKAVKGTEVTVTATPNKGWKTDSIKYNDTDISDAYKFTMPATDVTVVANFSRITVDVPVKIETTEDGKTVATVEDAKLDEALTNAADTGASQITVGSSDTVADTVTLPENLAEKLADTKVEAVEVATKAGSVVLPTEAIGDGAVEVSLATGEAEDGTKTMSLSVKGLKPNAKITVKPAGMTLTPGKTYTYVDSEGKTQTVTVKDDGTIELPTNASGEIKLDNVQFVEVQTYTITVETAEHGKVTTDPADKAPAGAKVTVTAKADTGYKLNKITVTDASGAKVTVASDNTFTMPSSNVTVSATFTKSSGSSGGGGGGGGGGATSYSVKVASTEHGKVTARPDSAVKDQKVTITVTPDKGYALDTLTVTDANGKTVTLTKVNDTTYTFLMPGVSVTVDADFVATGEEPAETPKFSDVADKSYTFYADIMWAAEKGYMNGYSNGTFRPNNSTTRQALWMVLARIDGANPSDMSAARAWAMASKISDGTNPEAAMSRQQMVTMLYRYAQLKGYKTSGGTSISAYPDAAGVASYAQDAMSWAVGNGIVTGTSDGRLNPAGTASRAHFAAFLHRFCTTAGIA